MRMRIFCTAFLFVVALPVLVVSQQQGRYPVGASTDNVDGLAVELRAARPTWLTRELQALVDLLGVVQLPDSLNDLPLPSEIGIRPGAWMTAPAGCTMNFIFQRSGTFAIGTAGHCVEYIGQPVYLLVLAPPGALSLFHQIPEPVVVRVGQVLTLQENGVGDDFALVSIRDDLQSWVSPTMAAVAGPCGAYTGSGPETVWHYGHGIGIGTGGTPRAGLALKWLDDAYGWEGAGIFGDSGSPVRVDTGLQAAGNLTHLIIFHKDLTPSTLAGTRITRMLEIANGWTLAHSPIC